MKFLFSSCFLISCFLGIAQQSTTWQTLTDSIQSFSSPRACDLNNDGILDIVVGGGTDGVASNNGIMAYNGANGALLWKRGSRNEVFGSAVFQDITNDGIKDVYIAGRQAQLLAINGANGQLLWDFFPHPVNPADSGLYNFYNPQIIHDVNNDGTNDLLVANGGDHAAPDWQTNRPPGHLMVISGLTGNLLAKAVVPDSAEIYCSPIVLDVQNNGTQWVLFGTGGENLGGSFWACPLLDLINTQSLLGSINLVTDPNKGFIAPTSVHKTQDGSFDFYVLGFGGKLTKFKGLDWSTAWSYQHLNTESSAAPVIGNFVGGDMIPDVFISLYKGSASSYSDFYQIMLNGHNGQVIFKDSLGTMGYPSANAVDLNNDGRDEVVVSLTYFQNGHYKHKLQAINFQTNQVYQLGNTLAGVNLGCTPFIGNLDFDSELELVFVVKRDSINPVGWKGIFVNRMDLSSVFPNSGVAWGSYMSGMADGQYQYSPINCGQGSIVISGAVINPSCNGLSNGLIDPVLSGIGPYTYLWSNGSADSVLLNISAGAYWLRVTNAFGCYEERNIMLVDPYTISFGGIIPPVCPGGTNGSATLSSTGCPCQFSTCTYLWDNGVTTKPNNSLTSGWHSVNVNHPDGCVVVSNVFIPYPLPIVVDTVIIQNVCFGENFGSIELISSNYQPVTYNWSNGGLINEIDSLSVGSYTVFVSDARGCFDSLQFNITQPEALIVTAETTPIQCAGDNNGQIMIGGQGGTGNYTYWLNEQLTSPLNSSLTSGDYVISLMDENACSSQDLSVTIIEPEPLVLTLTSTPQENVLDGTASASVTGGTAPYSYSWNDINNQTEEVVVYLNSGWYTVNITDANGCQVTDSVFVEYNAGIAEPLSQSIGVYPNPVDDLLNISVMVDFITIFDASGRECGRYVCGEQFDVSRLQSGVYQLFIERNGIFVHLPMVKK